MSYHIDSDSVHSIVLQVLFIGLGYVSAAIGHMDLQDISLTVAITVGMDTLMGNPIKTFMKKQWSKLIK